MKQNLKRGLFAFAAGVMVAASVWSLLLAVTLHNLPEGMAVGIVFAGWLSGNVAITLSAAFALAIGIAIQNFPEVSEGDHFDAGTILFAVGFTLMMALDSAL